MSLRIAMLSTPLVRAGGAERQFFEEAKALRARGHTVSMLTFALRPEALFVDGITASDITVLSARGRTAGQVAALRAGLATQRPDVLVSHTSPELTWLSTRGAGVPYVQYHNSPPFYIGPDANPYMRSRRYRRVFASVRDDVAGYADLAPGLAASDGRRAVEAELRTALKHRALRGARAVIVPSHRTARDLRRLHGVEAAVVRGCLTSDAISTSTGQRTSDPVVLSVCRLEPVKRIDLLLQSFATVTERVPAARLIVAGTGGEAVRLQALARALGIEDAVEFTGYIPDGELPALHARARTFAAPAMADFNIAPYEALAAGCNVVWTTEMETEPAIEVSGRVFVAEPQPEAFAAGLLDALAADTAASIDLSSMTWDARAAKLESIYEGIALERAA